MRQPKRIQGRQGLQLSEQGLQILVETIPALVWRAKPDGHIDYVNNRLLEFFGSRLEEIIGLGWIEKVHPDDAAFKTQDWLGNMEAMAPHDANCRLQGADGTYKWFNVRGEPLRDNDGRVQNWYGVLIDIDNQKNAEEKARESELKLRQITDTVPGLVWSHGPDGEPTDINQCMVDYSGLSFEQFRDRGWEAFVHPVDFIETLEACDHAIQTGTCFEGIMRLRRGDGEFRWHKIRCEPLRDEEGRLVQWYGVALDIDEMKKIEDRLRRSETYLTEAQRLTHCGSAAYNETEILYYSEEAYRLFGFDPLQGGPSREAVWQRIHPDDLDRTNETIERGVREKKSFGHEFRIVLPDGTIRHVEAMNDPLFSASGELTEIIVTGVDVTDRKRAEEAIRESEYKLRQIIETVPTFLWSTEPDGKVSYVNQRILDYCGVRLEDFVRDGWGVVLHPDDFPETVRSFSHAIETGTSHEAVHRVRRSDGEYRWYHSRSEPLRNQQGRVVQWYGLTMDIDEAKKAEDRLRSSEAYLAETQRLSRSGTAVYNYNELLYFSDETYRIFELDPRNGLPSREAAVQLIHDDDRERVQELAWRAVREKRGFSLAYRLALPTSVKYIEANAHPKFSPSGELMEIVSTIIDVTDRKRAEQALQESEARARSAIDGIAGLIVILTPNGQLETVNRQAFEYFGQSLEQLGQWETSDTVHPEDLPHLVEVFRRAIASGTPFHIDLRLRRFDGEYRWFDTRGVPIRDDSGRIVRWYDLLTDIEDRKRAEQALRESERNARSAIDGIAGMVAILAPNGEVETVNRQNLEYFGLSLKELKNWGTSDFIHPEELPVAIELVKRGLASGLPFNFELRLRRFDGEYRWFDTRVVPIRDDSGRIVRWYNLLLDIEDRTRALAQLEQMRSDFAHINRVSMMGELAASLSHEITQPIASARNNARAAQNFLDMQPPDLSEVREALGCVVGDTDRAGDIVDRIRDHINKTPPRKERFDLNEAINEVIVLGRSTISKNAVSLQTRLSDGLVPVHCDRVQLQQVVLNLILNAAEAMGSVEAGSRELMISTAQHHTGVLVAVRDSGPGIDPTHLERVFGAFYTTKPHGVGMGLSICRSIIDAHGGRLWVEVNEPRGATFQFTLPAVLEP
jgi:PAS domain S-box-containing protein